MANELFDTAPEEVVRYFRAKRTLPSFDWREVAPEEHAFSFTVAKSAGFEVLDDIRTAVDEAIVNRVKFEDFRTRLTPILQEKGWWGKRLVEDPATGDLRLAQLGSPRRLKIIYWANTRTAHAAGEWERTQANRRFLPFLLYTLSAAENKRPEHRSWVGTVLPVGHPWWQTHYPPNGWGCQCGVRQISAREAHRRGYSQDTPAPKVELRPWRNRRTGRTEMVPRGIDPGWAQNPGQNRARNVTRFLADRLEEMPENRRRIAVADLVGSRLFRALVAGELPASTPERGRFALPVAMLRHDQAKRIGAKSRTVLFSNASAHKQLKSRAGQALSRRDYEKVQRLLETGDWFGDAGSVVIMGEVEGKVWRAVLKPVAGMPEVFLTSLHREEPRKWRAWRRTRKRLED